MESCNSIYFFRKCQNSGVVKNNIFDVENPNYAQVDQKNLIVINITESAE